MKTIKKGKTIWIALICSLLLHVFFIRYIDNIFARLPVDKTFKKQSVAYIALGQKNRTITPVGDPDIQKYVELIETQNSGNQDIDEKSIIPEKSILKKSIPEEISNEIQAIKMDKKENLVSSEPILKPNIKTQTDTSIKEEMTKDIFSEENIDESEKLNEKIPVKKLQKVNEMHLEKKNSAKTRGRDIGRRRDIRGKPTGSISRRKFGFKTTNSGETGEKIFTKSS